MRRSFLYLVLVEYETRKTKSAEIKGQFQQICNTKDARKGKILNKVSPHMCRTCLRNVMFVSFLQYRSDPVIVGCTSEFTANRRC